MGLYNKLNLKLFLNRKYLYLLLSDGIYRNIKEFKSHNFSKMLIF